MSKRAYPQHPFTRILSGWEYVLDLIKVEIIKRPNNIRTLN
jgi:hypothetical protein